MRELSVVFKVNDEDKFRKEVMDDLKKSFLIQDEGLPYSITAMSTSNEFSRVELIEQVMQEYNFDEYDKVSLIKEILNLHGEGLYKEGKKIIEEWKQEYCE